MGAPLDLTIGWLCIAHPAHDTEGEFEDQVTWEAGRLIAKLCTFMAVKFMHHHTWHC